MTEAAKPAAVPPPLIGTIEIPASGKKLDDIEREAIMLVYHSTGQIKTKTAFILGISTNTLHRKLRRYEALDTIKRRTAGP